MVEDTLRHYWKTDHCLFGGECGFCVFFAILTDIFQNRRGRNGQLGRSDHIESVAAPRLTPVECSFFAGMKVLDVVSFGCIFFC